MEIGDSYPGAFEKLVAFDQQHLLAFWDELDDGQRQILLGQINQIDFNLVQQLFAGGSSKVNWLELAKRPEPPQAFRLAETKSQFSTDDARAAAEKSLRAGQIGAILVAGGQGTRLGFAHPKGMYPIGPVSQATLFQILLEKVAAVGRRYGVEVPLNVMTSDATHDETQAFLGEHRYFGLRPENVRLFCQGVMPAVDAASGKILLAEKGSIALSPDGHGGMLTALVRNRLLSGNTAPPITTSVLFSGRQSVGRSVRSAVPWLSFAGAIGSFDAGDCKERSAGTCWQHCADRR